MKLIKLNSGYQLRRWVPLDLRKILGKNEIWHTLETHDKEIAKIRGCAIFGLTSQFFTVVRHRIMINKNSYIYDKTTSLIDNLDTDHDKIILSKIIETYENLVKELKAQQRISEAEALLTRMQDYDRYNKLKETVEESKPKLDYVLDYLKDNKNFDAYKAVQEINNRFTNVESWTKPPELKKSPLLSTALNVYLEKSEDKLKDSDKRGYLNTFRRFLECNGDKEIRKYNGEDAGNFRELMAKMPENYGKNRNDQRTIYELTELADKQKLVRISDKTIKNHFARLSSVWRYYLSRELVDRNIFSGDWQFTSKKKIKRVKWDNKQLEILLNAEWNSPTISRKYFMFIVGIGAYTGMRLEEICRIRIEDIIEIRGIHVILIQEHEARKNRPWEYWNPKTEAGERAVPICETLINCGFLKFVNSQKSRKQYYLFSDLRFSGKDKKRSDAFQQAFSRFKLRKKIPRGVDFHSFRHNVSTKLRNLPEYAEKKITEVWINDFMGHEGNIKSVGVKSYLDEIEIENLKKVADSMTYPEFFDIRKLAE